MNPPAIQVSDIAHTIQLALAPVFLLASMAGILNMLAGRLTRIVDRSRTIAREIAPPGDPVRKDQASELRMLDRRMSLVNWAIFFCTSSALAICVVVAGLFVAALGGFGFARTVAMVFVVAMLLLITALLLFLVEVRLARRTVRVAQALLDHPL